MGEFRHLLVRLQGDGQVAPGYALNCCFPGYGTEVEWREVENSASVLTECPGEQLTTEPGNTSKV